MQMDVYILLQRLLNTRYGRVDTLISSRGDVGRVGEVVNN